MVFEIMSDTIHVVVNGMNLSPYHSRTILTPDVHPYHLNVYSRFPQTVPTQVLASPPQADCKPKDIRILASISNTAYMNSSSKSQGYTSLMILIEHSSVRSWQRATNLTVCTDLPSLLRYLSYNRLRFIPTMQCVCCELVRQNLGTLTYETQEVYFLDHRVLDFEKTATECIINNLMYDHTSFPPKLYDDFFMMTSRTLFPARLIKAPLLDSQLYSESNS